MVGALATWAANALATTNSSYRLAPSSRNERGKINVNSTLVRHGGGYLHGRTHDSQESNMVDIGPDLSGVRPPPNKWRNVDRPVFLGASWADRPPPILVVPQGCGHLQIHRFALRENSTTCPVERRAPAVKSGRAQTQKRHNSSKPLRPIPQIPLPWVAPVARRAE